MDNREAVNWLINISADIGKAEYSDLWHYERALTEIKDMLESIQPVVTDTNVGDKISKFIDGLEEIFADIRERHVDDSVCGLCEYDGAYMGQSGDWCNECPGFDRDDCFKLSDKTRKEWTEEIVKALPTIQPEKAQLSQEGTTKDVISRRAAIDAVDAIGHIATMPDGDKCIRRSAVKYTLSMLPPAQPETLTDKEQRIFLAAMGREEKVCRQVDDECGDCRDSDSLVRTCHEITRKVKGTLWT